jgi:cytoskeleton bundling-enhancing protein CbeA-like protein
MNNHITTSPTWGLKRDITPRLGARLVQEGAHLHFLSDRANIAGTFSLEATQALDAAFPALIT